MSPVANPAIRPLTLPSLPRSHAELLELQLVLETGAQFFDDAAQSASAAHSERADDAGAWPLRETPIQWGSARVHKLQLMPLSPVQMR